MTASIIPGNSFPCIVALASTRLSDLVSLPNGTTRPGSGISWRRLAFRVLGSRSEVGSSWGYIEINGCYHSIV